MLHMYKFEYLSYNGIKCIVVIFGSIWKCVACICVYKHYENIKGGENKDMNKAEKYIKNGYNLLIVLAVINLMVSIAYFATASWEKLIISITTVFIEIGLSYGVYKKSRVCAIISLVLCSFGFISYIISKKGQLSLVSMAVVGVCIYFLAQGVIGTISHNKLNKKEVKIQA